MLGLWLGSSHFAQTLFGRGSTNYARAKCKASKTREPRSSFRGLLCEPEAPYALNPSLGGSLGGLVFSFFVGGGGVGECL